MLHYDSCRLSENIIITYMNELCNLDIEFNEYTPTRRKRCRQNEENPTRRKINTGLPKFHITLKCAENCCLQPG